MEPKTDDERGSLIGIWLAYDGELRAALARVVLVACCYAAQLLLTFVLSGTFTVMAIFFLSIASFIAFFVWCLTQL